MTDGSRLDDRVVQVVVALVALGLLARFVFLGTRVSHFDEARVAFWTLQYLDSGQFYYRFIIHGPFVQHVDRLLFAVLGPTDFAARVPVALVGGLLPLSALWFRHRLSDTEVGALAFFLACNPILLYYSRFMRSTLLVAAFCFVSFAAFLRFYDGLGVGYFHAGMAMLALGFAAKENAVVYILCWLGAGALVLHHKVYRHEGADSGVDWLKGALRSIRDRVAGPDNERLGWSAAHAVGGVVLFLAVAFFFYAPRGGDVGLYQTLMSPSQFPELVNATVTDVSKGYGYWFGGSGETTLETYVERVGKILSAGTKYAGGLLALAVAGFVVEHYAHDDHRLFVLGAGYWGFASILGYPLGTDIWAAWIIVNALVPLALPAAVGLSLIVDAGRDALADGDRISVGAVAVLLLLVAGQVATAGVTGVYLNPTEPDNELVQYAQPQQEMRGAMDDMAAIADRNGGPDALVYGSYVDGQTSAERTPACIDWFDSLPLAWYLESDDVETTCAQNGSDVPDDLPPVIITPGTCSLDRVTDCRRNPDAIEAPAGLRDRIPQRYERHAFLLRTTAKPTVVYVDPEA